MKHCTSQGAQIASIHNDEENDAVAKLNAKYAYLGAESDGKGNWKWHDGSAWWQPAGIEDNIRGVKETRIGLGGDSKWYDWQKGQAQLGVVCAKSLRDSSASSGTHPSHARYACLWPVHVSALW